jgi:hypothetical protein
MSEKKATSLQDAVVHFLRAIHRSPTYNTVLHIPEANALLRMLGKAEGIPAPMEFTVAEVDAYFYERTKVWDEELRKREQAISHRQRQLHTRCKELAVEIEALPRLLRLKGE